MKDRQGAYQIESAHLALHFARKAEQAPMHAKSKVMQCLAAIARAQASLSALQDAETLLAARYPALAKGDQS